MPIDEKNSEGLISVRQLQVFELILFGILTCAICFLGIMANAVNMIIFYKQGLHSTMNISLFALAISDFFGVLTLEWVTIGFNPLFLNSGFPWDTKQVMYLTAGWPHLCFGRITCWITTYITAERCLCIALPIKVKQIITPRRTTFIICIIYLMNVLATIPTYSSAYLEWNYFPVKNRTLLSFTARENISVMEPIAFVLYAVLGTVSFPPVIVLTGILVYNLKQQSKWRAQTTCQATRKTEMTTKRDIKTMNMVVFIAGILIICYTPGVMVSLTASFVPSFNIVGKNVNLYYTMWAFVTVFEATNSSINIILYYQMSSKYKQTFILSVLLLCKHPALH